MTSELNKAPQAVVDAPELPPPAIGPGNCFPYFADAADQPYYTEQQVLTAIAADRAQRQKGDGNHG